ncbi:exodeoxyribonuclease VII large subunit [Gilvimarinus gilvus]
MTTTAANQNARDILSVSRLNRACRQLLETHLPMVWVEGEISNLARPSSGHWYFTLKDDQAQVRCAMFRNRNQLVKFTPDHGAQVLIRARVSIYEGRGDYQLIAEHMEEAGLGALQRAFEALKLRLNCEGLFAPEHKLPLPSHPQHIAVITSATGAAIRDILSVAHRRYPGQAITVIPVPVQGEQAAPAIINALRQAQQSTWFDAIILARGGGSIEDLWAFNDESLARAIFECKLPIISAVGHEIDFTIADFVADHRAPTPSAAAELLVPDTQALVDKIRVQENALTRAVTGELQRQQQRLEALGQRLRHPGEKLRHQAQQLDHLEARMVRNVREQQERQQQQFASLLARLRRSSPNQLIGTRMREVITLQTELKRAIGHKLQTSRQSLHEQMRVLDSVSPLATLERGFAAITDGEGRLVKDYNQVQPGEHINARLGRGRLHCEVIASDG